MEVTKKISDGTWVGKRAVKKVSMEAGPREFGLVSHSLNLLLPDASFCARDRQEATLVTVALSLSLVLLLGRHLNGPCLPRMDTAGRTAPVGGGGGNLGKPWGSKPSLLCLM